MVARKKKEAEEKAEMQDLKKEADLRLTRFMRSMEEFRNRRVRTNSAKFIR